jgi:hypothetical protein
MTLAQMEQYIIEYPYGREQWAVLIYAESFEDAEARLKAMGWGKVKGVVVGKVPHHFGWVVRIYAWVQNLFAGKS